MTGIAAQPQDESMVIEVERMLDDGAPAAPTPRARRSGWASVPVEDELAAEERAAQRRAARRVFRLYCFACGRSTEVSVAPARPGRCLHCGGTMLVEAATPD